MDMSNINGADIEKIKEFLLKIIDKSNPTGKRSFYLKHNGDDQNVQAILDITSLREWSLKYKSFAFNLDGCMLLFYDDTLSFEKQLNIIAHEAGHALLGHCVFGNDEMKARNNNPRHANEQTEWEANFFSAAFMFLVRGALPIMEAMKGGAAL